MFFITTETAISDYEVTERLGVVYGVSVYSRTDFGDTLASIKAAFGGKQKGYVKMIEKNRDDALETLMANAEDLGADAVIGMRFDSNEFRLGEKPMNEVVAYGTAVKIRKVIHIDAPQNDA